MALSKRYIRPRAYDHATYQWHLGRVPKTIELEKKRVPHPSWTSAIFVVHGIGTQLITETAATLRSGFEDAAEQIVSWQRENNITSPFGERGEIPPPLIAEGYWANYQNLKETFPKDWDELKGNKRSFFENLWKTRLLSSSRTCWWFVGQQVRLLNPKVIFDISFFAWLLYIPLQVVSLTLLLIFLIRFPRVLTNVLGDVRLYVAPRGITERAIVQRIDYRVGAEFLKLIGLDWNFRPLPSSRQKSIGKKPIVFNRIEWVAHSLGTVISYNVLSDLFFRAQELSQNGDRQQKEGVETFRSSLRRFVTLGSPLDKIAYLFGKQTLRPWSDTDRQNLIGGGETVAGEGKESPKEWWINFYHVLDPVSGALSGPMICGPRAPMNLHIGLLKLPGVAHTAYWKDEETLRFILGRAYGKKFLQDRENKPYSAFTLTLLASVGYLIWMGLIFGIAYAIIRFVPLLVGLLFG